MLDQTLLFYALVGGFSSTVYLLLVLKAARRFSSIPRETAAPGQNAVPLPR